MGGSGRVLAKRCICPHKPIVRSGREDLLIKSIGKRQW